MQEKWITSLNKILDYFWRSTGDDLKKVLRPFEGTYDRLKDDENYGLTFEKNLFEKYISPEVVFEDKDEDLKKYIDSLSHISMSPKRKDIFEKFYIIDKESPDLVLKNLGIKNMVTLSSLKVNESKRRVDAFAKLLIKEAQRLVHYQRDQDISFAKYILVGRPGIGKTAFINETFGPPEVGGQVSIS